MFSDHARAFVERARVGRLATVDPRGRPHAIPICFATVDGEPPTIVSPIDEKPKPGAEGPSDLTRVRNVEATPAVTLLIDRYVEDWDRLAWVQVRGRATVTAPDRSDHDSVVAALRTKYVQYREHDLETRPAIRIRPGSVRSWGALDPEPTDGASPSSPCGSSGSSGSSS